MSLQTAVKATVHGKVQGVYFRASTRKRAVELNLTGYIRNLSDGMSVEVQVEGKKAQIDKLLEYLKQGPPGAKVDKVDIEWMEYTGSYKEFSITY
jgi:acylphosphatase